MNVTPVTPSMPLIPSVEIKLGALLAPTDHADVHLATWQRAEVVVKRLKVARLDAQSREEFLREASLTHQMRHPRIVHLYGICDEPSNYCLVIEHVAKGSLQFLLESPEPLSWKIRLQIAEDVATGLAHLHDKGILHRDLKSPNVLIEATNRAKISDFGLSKLKEQIRNTTSFHGSYAWSAPELTEDPPIYSEKSDVFALGMVFWELTSRQIPYKGLTIPGIIKKLDNEQHRPKISDDTPALFASLIRDCWKQAIAPRPLCPQIIERIKSISLPQEAPVDISPPIKPEAAQVSSRPAIAFGAAEWSTYFGDVGAEPPLPTNIHDILNAPCPYWPDKKVSETHMLVLIPEKVNGRPLTLTTLGELVQAPKKGSPSKYGERHCHFHAYKDTPAPAAHWILMTKDVIPGSRNKAFTVQKALLKGGDTVPKLLDATTAIFMQNASGGKHGYGRDPRTYTRCEEPYYQYRMVVGGFAPPPGGLLVYDGYVDNERDGLAAFRKFV